MNFHNSPRSSRLTPAIVAGAALVLAMPVAAQFAPSVSSAVPSTNTLAHVVFSDRDGDGLKEMVAVTPGSDEVHYWNNTAGTFPPVASASIACPPSSRPIHLSTGDLDNLAGGEDLAICEPGFQRVALMYQPSGIRQNFTIPGWIPVATCIVDIDRDGRNDVAVVTTQAGGTQGRVWVIKQTGPMAFILLSTAWLTEQLPMDIDYGDFDGDGDADLVVPNMISSSYTVLQNGSTPGFVSYTSIHQPSPVQRPERVATADHDCNGFVDFGLLSRGQPNQFAMMAQGPTGTMNFNPLPVLVGTGAYDIATGDIDGSGADDLLFAFAGPGPSRLAVAYWLGASFGAVSTHATTGMSSRPSLAVGDIDGNCTPDVAFADDTQPDLAVFNNLNNICCHVYEDGIDDSYDSSMPTTSPENTCPCPPLLTFHGAAPRELFMDEPVVNEAIIHSFERLSGRILCAELEISIRGGVGCNGDALQLGFDPSSPGFQWTRRLASLAQTGLSWNPGDSTVLRLNLADLPGGLNLLPLMNKNGCFDLRLQRNTAVDYAVLRVKAAAQTGVLDCELGLDQSPLIRGTTVTWNVSGAVPGEPLFLLGNAFGPGPGPCVFTVCMCVGQGASTFDFQFADAAGNGTLTLNLPPLIPLPCFDITSQVIGLGSLRLSPVLTNPIY